MRKFLLLGLFSALMFLSCGQNEQRIYIISTNDIHASIDTFPELATLVKSYEGHGEVLIVDSGDRVSGNAYVDDAEQGGMPIIELMNSVGYDIVTLGNHEFDKGFDNLKTMAQGSEFEWICANMQTTNNEYPFERYTTYDINGVKIGFIGIVDTDSNGHPLGKESIYDDLRFENDVECAAGLCEEIASDHDFIVVLSHMGLEMDLRFIERTKECDWVVGGHSHDLICEKHGNTQISQNNKNLRYVTVAKITVCNNTITKTEYEQIDMSTIQEDAAMRKLVDKIKLSDPKLNEVIATTNDAITHDGVANLTIESIMEYNFDNGFKPEVCFYHFGGVRLSSLNKGDIRRVDILNNDPFISTIYIGEMTPEQMQRFILDKYNSGSAEYPDKESHYPYFRSNIPYQILLGSHPSDKADATDIRIELKEGRKYRVAMCNYIAESYIDKEIVDNQLYDSKVLVRDAMLDYVTTIGSEGYNPNNTSLQTEIKSE